jgi:hypothetical protein
LSFFSDKESFIAEGFKSAFALLAQALGLTEVLDRTLSFSKFSKASLEPNFAVFYLFFKGALS